MFATPFTLLDENFEMYAPLQATNIQWRRKYYEYGEFEIQMVAEDYAVDSCYVWHLNTNEVGIIEKVQLESEAKGNFITISGHFIEFWLSRGVVLDTLTTTTKIEELCKKLVQNRIINDLGENRVVVGTCESTGKTTDAYPENATEVGEITQSLLKSAEFSQKLEFDYETKKFTYQTWQGVDRTVAGPDMCTFSDKLGNVNKIDYDYDESAHKNYAEIIIDRGDDVPAIYTHYSNAKTGEPLKKLRLDISDTESETSEIAIASAQQKGLLELLNHYIQTNISFTPLYKWYKYHDNYDLGDKTKLVVSDVEKTFSFRIVEIDELYKNNHLEIELQFGDLKKLNYQKGRY